MGQPVDVKGLSHLKDLVPLENSVYIIIYIYIRYVYLFIHIQYVDIDVYIYY